MIKITSNNAPFLAKFGSAKHTELVDKKYGNGGVADFDLTMNPNTPSHIISDIVDRNTIHSAEYNNAIKHDNLPREKFDSLIDSMFNSKGYHLADSKHFSPEHIDKIKFTPSTIRHTIASPKLSEKHLDKLLTIDNMSILAGSYDSSIRSLSKNPELKPRHVEMLLKHSKIDNLDVSDLIDNPAFTKDHVELIQHRIPKSQSIRDALKNRGFD